MTDFSNIPELQELEGLLASNHDSVRTTVPLMAGRRGEFPVYVLELGCTQADAPAIGFFAGVHGNERIGSQIVLAFLHSILERTRWDESLHALLSKIRLVFMPIVNPSGMNQNTRCTSSGIDLMRNAPIDSPYAHWLLGGQRISRHLPWYRGKRGEIAPENLALFQTVRRRLLGSELSIALDCHSGFGYRDRIWFPYAGSCSPLPHLADIYALRSLFRQTLPNHTRYRIEPQCLHYMTHGDVWDYLYRESLEQPSRTFLPLTLEMGSWLWLRKNPRQIFSRIGLFNPLVPHRQRRILRQHLLLFDFLTLALRSHHNWLPTHPDKRPSVQQAAGKHWQGHYKSMPDCDSVSQQGPNPTSRSPRDA